MNIVQPDRKSQMSGRTIQIPRTSRRREQDGMTARPKPDAERSGKVLGRSLPRLEDAPLLTGRGRFVDDINFPGQLHMRIVRSEHAHGDIVSIDAEAARAMPGVVAVWTGEDIRDLPPIDFRDPAAEGAEALPPAGARAGPRALCRRAGRRRLRRARLYRRRRGQPRQRRDRRAARRSSPPRTIRANSHPVFRPNRSRLRNSYGDLDARVRRRGAYHRARSLHRAPFRRAARDARRARALRPRARRARALRRGQGPAPHARQSRAHPGTRAHLRASEGRPHRRRLRHPRRALSRRRARLASPR